MVLFRPTGWAASAGLKTVVAAPHLLLVPSIVLVLLVGSLSGVSEGLRRALDVHEDRGVDVVHGQ